MEAALPTEAITRVLTEAPAPLRAVDIVRKLIATGVVASKETVNKTLYSGPFERGPAATGAPVWTTRRPAPAPAGAPEPGHFTFAIGGVGTFTLRDECAGDLGPLLAAAMALAPAEVTVRVDDTAGGKKAASLALELRGVEALRF